MTETIFTGGGCYEHGRDYDADLGRETWDEYAPSLEVDFTDDPNRLPYRLRYADYDQYAELTEEQLRDLAKQYADAVAAIDAHRAARKGLTMNFWTARAAARLTCASQSAANPELAVAYIGEAAALLDAAIEAGAWPQDVRQVLQELTAVSRVLMEAWRPAQPDPAFDVTAFAVHDFNDES